MTRTRRLVATLGALAAIAPAAQARDFAQTALNVLSPGQDGGLPLTAHSTDQNALYDGLTPLFGSVTAGSQAG